MNDSKKSLMDAVAQACMTKSDISDFPLLDYPCEHWFVRYAVSCEYPQKIFDEIWEKKLESIKKKYNFDSFCYSGCFSFSKISEHYANAKTQKEKDDIIKRYMNSKILITVKEGDKFIEKEVDKASDLWSALSSYLKEQEEFHGWIDCPYQNEHQSQCPFYKPSKFYVGTPLEELRKRRE
jgi:hypothetical protein